MHRGRLVSVCQGLRDKSSLSTHVALTFSGGPGHSPAPTSPSPVEGACLTTGQPLKVS